MPSDRIWAEINLNALENNLLVVKSLVKPARILLAIKADAYGLGAVEIARFLENKIDMFGVASVEEGMTLRTEAKVKTPILILSPIPYESIPLLFKYQLTPNITEKDFCRYLMKKAQELKTVLKIHLEVDTGMGRTGFSLNEAKKIIKEIRAQSWLQLEGIFSHFPAAESDLIFTKEQLRDFQRFAQSLNFSVRPSLHIANSAGLLNLPFSALSMVRPGLIVYGIIPNGIKNRLNFLKKKIKPVLSLRSILVNIRPIKQNTSISYARTFFTRRDSQIGVIACGYGDGYPYHLSNRGEVIIRGQRVPIVGQVCMDLTMIDLTSVPQAKIGDKVTLIGVDGKEEIKVEDLAFWANTIPYEITTRISPRVPRFYLLNGQIKSRKNLIDKTLKFNYYNNSDD